METLNIDPIEMEIASNAAFNIIDKTSPVSSFNSVLFNKNGLFAVNSFCSLNYRFKNDIKETFGVSPDIFSIVKKIDNDYDLIVQESTLRIEADNIKAELNFISDIYDDVLPEFKDSEFTETSDFEPLPINFVSCLQRVFPYTVKVRDAVRTENHCFIVDKNKVYATNNKVMICAELDGEMERFLISAEVLKMLVILDPEEYKINEKSILFKIGNIIFSVRKMEETNFTETILSFFKKTMEEDNTNKFQIQGDFKQTLDEVSVFLSKSNLEDGIIFTPEEDRLQLSTKNSKGKIQGELFCPKGEFPENIKEFILSYKFLKPTAPTCEYFIEGDNYVIFIEETVSTIIMKIKE